MKKKQNFSNVYLRVSTFVVQLLSVAVLIGMVVINAFNIVSRAVFGIDHEFTQELSIIGAMVIYFFSIALISKGNIDIRIDFLVHLMPAPLARASGVMARLAVLAFQLAVLWLAIDTIGFVSVFHTPVLEISESVFYVPVIAGAVDILLTEAIHLDRQLRGKLGAPGTGLPI